MQPSPIYVNVRADRLTPPLTPEAVAYAWEQLLQRAGFASLNVPLWYADPADVPPGFTGVVVIPCPPDGFETLLRRAPGSLPSLPLERASPQGARIPVIDPLPILFWGEGSETDCPFAVFREDGVLIFYADVIAAVFFMLSRWEETVVPIRDDHGRFPATASVAYKQGFLDRPLVDEYALLLRAWLAVLFPRYQPQTRRFKVQLSSDVDHIRPFPTWNHAIHVLGGDLLKRHSLRRAWRTLYEMMAQVVRPTQTSEIRGINYLARLAAHYRLDAAFYFMAADPSPFDSGYDPAALPVRKLIRCLQQQGFEIGLHAGYYTLNDPTRLRDEKARLDAVLGAGNYGGRQHYLRFRVPDTWRHWEKAGLTYDASMGYADHEGFRCGTCHPFPPFDCQQNRELRIIERPLIVMDATLQRYRGLAPEEGEERILTLARRCYYVEGVFSLVWHPTLLRETWRPWADVCRRTLAEISRLQGEKE